MAMTEAEELELLELEEAEHLAMQAKPKETPSNFESAARGAAQGASLGFADEIVGGVEGAYNALSKDVPYAEAYEKARNESRNNFKNAESANPASYTTGVVGGSVASAFVPGLNIAKGASLGASVGKAALSGGLAGLGSSEADNATDMGIDTLKGAGYGAGGGLAGAAAGKLIEKSINGVSKVAPAITGSLDAYTDKMGIQALGPTIKQQKSLPQGTGKKLFDEGHIGFFSTADDTAKSLQSKMDELGDLNRNLVSSLDEQGKLIQTQPALEALKSRIDKLYADGEINKADALKRLYSNMLDRPEFKLQMGVKPSFLENVKRDAQTAFKTDVSSATKQAGREQATLLKQGVEAGLQEIAPEMAPTYAANNAQMSSLFAPMDIAEETALKEGRKTLGRFLDPQRALPEVYKSLRSPQKLGAISNKLSSIVQSAPERLGKYAPVLQQAAQRGGQSLAVTNYLLQQKDEEYRKQISSIEGQDGK